MTKEVLLLIADISGYTKFMLANQTELAHSHEIIAALLESIIAEVEIPLSVSKLEGDAVFLFAADDEHVRRAIGSKLGRFFEVFSSTLERLSTTLSCGCGACRNVGELRLKIIVHAGTALLWTIAGRAELAGIDVIMVHRLLKNSVDAHEYILLTDAAKRDLRLDLPIIYCGIENYENVGAVNVTVYLPTPR